MNAALKLIDTADKLARQRPDRLPSEKQSQVTANLSLIARTWRTLSDSQRQGWTDFGQTWSPNPKRKSTATGFIVFQSLNGVRLNSNQGQGHLLLEAPVQPDFIGKLPAFAVTATLPPTGTRLKLDTAPDSGPALQIAIANVPFPGPVIALATRPLSAGTGQPSPREFRQIVTLPFLAPTTDLTTAYLTQFTAPAVGMKVAVQLVPVTPNGFRGNPFTQTVTVTAAP